MAFALIVGYFYLGGMAVESDSSVSLGAISLAYASSSLFGYFGIGNAPIAMLMRVNMISVICAVIGVMSLLGSGMNLGVAALTALHIVDATMGVS